MVIQGKRGRHSQPINRERSNSAHSILSGLSTKAVNPTFFETNSVATHAQSQTWKSEEAKQREKFDRARNLLQYFVPEQFKARAKPSNGIANIVPRTFLQYQIHEKEMAADQMRKKLSMMEAKKLRKTLEPVRPAFDSKNFESDRSCVLSQQTIWSPTFQPTYEHPQIAWPDREQLHEDGEKRENKYAPTRCGRYLPALRYPDTGLFMQQYPLDQVGPLRSQGPTPAECTEANESMDCDPEFEGQGIELLGGDLMDELGSQQPAFVPDWLAQRRYSKKQAAAQYYQYEGGASTY